MMSHVTVFLILTGISCAYALWKGGFEERVVAGVFLLGIALTTILGRYDPRFTSFQTGVFLVDLAMYLIFLWMALRSSRYWLIWLSALQGVQVLSHLLGLPQSPMLNLTYAILSTVWAYPMMLLLIIATARSRKFPAASDMLIEASRKPL